jgi:CHAD domain-containing protein/CYTH domain-containing protein
MVELERHELLRPAEAGARLIALRLLDEARAACDRLGDPDDGEALHDLRVALRRLRSTLAAYRGCLDRDATRDALTNAGRLASQTGEARDAEVVLAWLNAKREELSPAHRALLDDIAAFVETHVFAARENAGRDLAKRYAALELDLRASLETYRARVAPSGDAQPFGFASAACEAVHTAAAELELALSRVSGPDQAGAEHAARIVAKRLRYLLEPVRQHADEGPDLLQDLRRLQDLMGDRHDREVLSATLRGALERAALANTQALVAAVQARDAHAERRLRARRAENLALELLRRARAEADTLFAELAAGWLEGKSAPFFARIDDFAEKLRQLDGANLEIERKYLLSGLPERVRGAESVEIEQGYLPGSTVRERLRRSVSARGARFTRTVKLGTGIVRAEFEEELPEAEFARLWPLTAGARLRKRRYRVPDGALSWEIDEFLERPLVLAEIELPTAQTEVHVPEWLETWIVREVTDEPAYTNLRLACEPQAHS